jgi:hypothetical protein
MYDLKSFSIYLAIQLLRLQFKMKIGRNYNRNNEMTLHGVVNNWTLLGKVLQLLLCTVVLLKTTIITTALSEIDYDFRRAREQNGIYGFKHASQMK